MPKHKSTPKTAVEFAYSTGRAPMATDGTMLAEQARHMLNWAKCGQIFTYAGPGPFDRTLVQADSDYIHLNPDYDYEGTPYFSIITKSEDFTNLGHQLGGYVIPWRYQKGATIRWSPEGYGSVQIPVWEAGADSHDDITAVRFSSNPTTRIKLYDNVIDYGVAGGGFSVQKLAYNGMMIAGVGLWAMPDRTLDTQWRLFDLEQFLTGRQVRGWVGTGPRRGLGKLLGELADIIYRTGRCLLQSGHPTGVCTYQTSYVNLRHDDSAFMVEPAGLFRGNDVPCTPCVVAGAVGASVGNPAYVKFESLASSDSYEFEITSDAEALYTAPAALDCYRFSEHVRVSIQAPTDGVVYVRTFAIWEG